MISFHEHSFNFLKKVLVIKWLVVDSIFVLILR